MAPSFSRRGGVFGQLRGAREPPAPRVVALVDQGLWPNEFLFTLGMIIGGGTSQIQKNIISERGLGMPRG